MLQIVEQCSASQLCVNRYEACLNLQRKLLERMTIHWRAPTTYPEGPGHFTYIRSFLESSASPCGVAKLPGAAQSAVPQRESNLPCGSKILNCAHGLILILRLVRMLAEHEPTATRRRGKRCERGFGAHRDLPRARSAA